MIPGETYYNFNLVEKNQLQYIATITIPNRHIENLYQEALIAQKEQIDTHGFTKGKAPIYYVEQNYKPNIIEHLKELFFNHCVMNFICQSLHNNKIVIAGQPTLVDIKLDPNNDAQYYFGINTIPAEWDDRWKKINYRVPERKNYKDIDKQVEFFIKEEADNAKKNNTETINIGDYVLFEMEILNKNNKSLLNGYKDTLWLKISDEESDNEFHNLFIGKKINDIILTKSIFLQNYISNELDMHYTFALEIKNFLPHSFFCFNGLNHHFQLKNSKQMHQKLIEVFSFRNDLSQRRETIEITLKHLLKQYYLTLPRQLLEKQKELVLNEVHNNPDYLVYKAQNDFKEKVKQLAEKQLKETVIIDAIGFQENIKVSEQDIQAYVNLLKRARTREFIYFKPPCTKYNGQEIPLPNEIIKQTCLREKTLNHIIQYLIKKNKKN